jgi:hypothetical protein
MKLLLRLLFVLLVAPLLCAMYGYSTATQSLSAVGTTTPTPVVSLVNKTEASPPWLQPAIIVNLTSGASLTYSVEVTGDDVLFPGYNPATGNWAPFTNMSGLTASATGTLGAAVTAVRLHVTAYSSGTATLQFVQQIVN